jgi:hypothetical protein
MTTFGVVANCITCAHTNLNQTRLLFSKECVVWNLIYPLWYRSILFLFFGKYLLDLECLVRCHLNDRKYVGNCTKRRVLMLSGKTWWLVNSYFCEWIFHHRAFYIDKLINEKIITCDEQSKWEIIWNKAK